MESNLQGALRQLSKALHGAIAASPEVEAALQRVRAAGYDASVVLEVTIALARRDEAGEGQAADEPAEPDAARGARQPVVLRWAEAPVGDEDSALFEILGDELEDETLSPVEPQGAASWAHEMGPGDRDYLRSLRIRIDE